MARRRRRRGFRSFPVSTVPARRERSQRTLFGPVGPIYGYRRSRVPVVTVVGRDTRRIARRRRPPRTYIGRDLRLYHPAGHVRPISRAGLRARGAGVGFIRPRSVEICVRRGRRREVLFAMGVGGSRGVGRGRRRRTNDASLVSCRR